jgi:hypothetical protein
MAKLSMDAETERARGIGDAFIYFHPHRNKTECLVNASDMSPEDFSIYLICG